MTRVIEKAVAILKSMSLCDYCLGRQFARLGYGLSNNERGRAIKTTLYLEAMASRNEELLKLLAENGGYIHAITYFKKTAISLEPKKCELCLGIMSEDMFRRIAERVVQELKDYEFSTFLVGATVPDIVRDKEDWLRSTYGIEEGEDLKNDVTREIGKLIAALTSKQTDFTSPDITIIVDIFNDRVKIFSNPLFIKGRYLKHSRQLPQSPWHCRKCWGKGCSHCNYSGREYPTSVAELVGGPAKEMFEAKNFKFHAAGREDVDALVEGEGRLFILELKEPKKRYVELAEVERKINSSSAGLVEVVLMGFSNRKEVRAIKQTASSTSKTYLVKAVYDTELEPEDVMKIEMVFRNRVVEQRTPTRVLSRRSDRIRKKTVYYVKANMLNTREIVFEINCQGGLYVKELIHGDNGRTSPSFAEILNKTPSRIELTVLRVEA